MAIDIKRNCASSIRDFPGDKLQYNDFTIAIREEEYSELNLFVIPQYLDKEAIPTSAFFADLLAEIIEAGIYHISQQGRKEAEE